MNDKEFWDKIRRSDLEHRIQRIEDQLAYPEAYEIHPTRSVSHVDTTVEPITAFEAIVYIAIWLMIAAFLVYAVAVEVLK